MLEYDEWLATPKDGFATTEGYYLCSFAENGSNNELDFDEDRALESEYDKYINVYKETKMNKESVLVGAVELIEEQREVITDQQSTIQELSGEILRLHEVNLVNIEKINELKDNLTRQSIIHREQKFNTTVDNSEYDALYADNTRLKAEVGNLEEALVGAMILIGFDDDQFKR